MRREECSERCTRMEVWPMVNNKMEGRKGKRNSPERMRSVTVQIEVLKHVRELT